ncbi:hypothetical protein AVEN_27402-1 [Araneus ventricosus]|uniref:Uncharacterized protein n=1 Tax=Araneus ventricosus TaxID=182803 RepID=A0A4Y2NPF8_ARAVE|nr:hypothetical protein AVEN_27402-1 [Araneus ventricosus]
MHLFFLLLTENREYHSHQDPADHSPHPNYLSEKKGPSRKFYNLVNITPHGPSPGKKRECDQRNPGPEKESGPFSPMPFCYNTIPLLSPCKKIQWSCNGLFSCSSVLLL